MKKWGYGFGSKTFQSANNYSSSPALTSNSSLVDSIFTRTMPRSHSDFPTKISLFAFILSACLNTLQAQQLKQTNQR